MVIRRVLKWLKWSVVSIVGFFLVLIGLGAIIQSSHTLTAADHAAGQAAVNQLAVAVQNTPAPANTDSQQTPNVAAQPVQNTPVAANTTPHILADDYKQLQTYLASGDKQSAYALAEAASVQAVDPLIKDGWYAVMDYLDSGNQADLYDAQRDFNL